MQSVGNHKQPHRKGAEMKIVIDIPPKTLEYYIRLCDSGEIMNNIEEIVASGTPLPEVLDSIKGKIKEKFYSQYNGDEFYEDAVDIIDKYGKEHWIITYPHRKDNPIYECPCCHASNSSVFKNFCPNCGADMRAKEDR